jgi:uncharacterized protein YciI
VQFLYRVEAARPEMLSEGPDDREAAVLADHFNYLDQLVQTGKVHLAGRTLNAATFGIVIFYAEDEPSAISLMTNDPAVKERVMTAELFPFNIALCASPEALHD